MGGFRFDETIRAFLPHLTAAALLVSATLVPPALKSIRPTPERAAQVEGQGQQWLPARLWQDPFLAVDETLAGSDWADRISQIQEQSEKPTYVRLVESTGGPIGIGPSLFNVLPRGVEAVPALSGPFYPRWLPSSMAVSPPSPRSNGDLTRAPDSEPDSNLQLESKQEPKPDPDPASHAKKSAITVLGASLRPGFSVDDIESRRRTRYAVLSALSRLDYLPIDAEHLGVFLLNKAPWQRLIRVPYEWLKHRSKPEYVLILWHASDYSDELIKQDFVGGRWVRLSVLREVMNSINSQMAHPMVDAEVRHWRLLGPRTSSGLKRLVSILCKLHRTSEASKASSPDSRTQPADQLLESVAEPSTDLLRKLEIFSPFATAGNHVVGLPQTNQARQTVPEGTALCKWATLPEPGASIGDGHSTQPARIFFGGKLVRVTCTDDQLVKALIQELKVRHIDPIQGDRVLLAYEWDTLYARELRRSFVQGFESKIRNPNLVFPEFSYLRGIDGQVPSRPRRGNRSEGSDQAGANRRVPRPNGTYVQIDNPSIERPEGRRQSDYIRRMALKVERQLEGVQLTEDATQPVTGPIRAVGIFGVDQYDKLILLQALRKRFPHAVFFTTDLDARLLHAEENDYTRNLIVASSYGLALHEGWQGNVPPFRDNYQTGTFLATQLAVLDPHPVFKHAIVCSVEPQIIEVGRHGPVVIRSKVDDGSAAWFIYPLFRELDLVGWLPWCGALTIVLFLFALRCSAKMRRWLLQPGRSSVAGGASGGQASTPWYGRRGCVLVVGVLILYLLYRLVWVIQVDVARPGGEPLAWGVSAWPCAVLRVLAALIAGVGVIYVWPASGRFWRELAEDYGMEARTGTDRGLAGWWRAGVNDAQINIGNWDESWSRGRKCAAMAYHVFFAIRNRDSAFADDGKQLTSFETRPPIDAQRLFQRFEWLEHPYNRFIRLVAAGVLFVCFGSLVFSVWGTPPPPIRGDTALFVCCGALILALIPLWMVAFLVLDEFQIARWLAHELSKGRTLWPARALERRRSEVGVGDLYAAEFVDVRFIADWTKRIGRFILFPMVALLVLTASRSDAFDRWGWSVSLIIMVSTYFSILLVIVWTSRATADSVRKNALQRVHEYARMATGDIRLKDPVRLSQELPPAEPVVRRNKVQAEMITADILAVRDGAYSWLLHGPMVMALVTLVGGYSLLTLLEYFAMRP